MSITIHAERVYLVSKPDPRIGEILKTLEELAMSATEKLNELKTLVAENTNLAESNRLLVVGLVDKINELRALGDEAALDELLAAVVEQHADLTEAIANGTASQHLVADDVAAAVNATTQDASTDQAV